MVDLRINTSSSSLHKEYSYGFLYLLISVLMSCLSDIRPCLMAGFHINECKN